MIIMDNKVYNDKNVNCNPIHTNANEITPTIKDKLTTKTEIIECEKEKDSRRFTGKPIYTGLSDRAPMFTMKDGFIPQTKTIESDKKEEKSKTLTLKKS